MEVNRRLRRVHLNLASCLHALWGCLAVAADCEHVLPTFMTMHDFLEPSSSDRASTGANSGVLGSVPSSGLHALAQAACPVVQ